MGLEKPNFKSNSSPDSTGRRDKEWWDKIYSERECVFGTEPSALVREVPSYLESGKALDLGAGEGKNGLFLAKEGFLVTAVDSSRVALRKMGKFAEEQGVRVATVKSDIRTFEIREEQDIILLMGVLHHLSREEALLLLEKVRGVTREGGLNGVGTLTKESDFYFADPTTDRFYTDPEEMVRLYEGWDILKFVRKRREAVRKKPDGSPAFITVEELLARKPFSAKK